MKPLHWILPLLCLVSAAGVTGAFFLTGKPSSADEGKSTAAQGDAVHAASKSTREPAPSTAAWPSDVAEELRGVKAELAAIRRILEDGGGNRVSAAPPNGAPSSSAPRGNPREQWAALVQETETRMLIESISRQRVHTRAVLSQEEVSATDPDATPEVREMSAAALENLRGAVKALDDVRTAEEFARWHEHYSIEPLD